MPTSLAEQLQRLAVPQTDLLSSKGDKVKASFLFDAREAAGLNRETVYQIGLDGLDELIQKNPIFEQFKSTLFDITSKRFERAVESSESNVKLDKKIRQFLLLCSPYFLLSCTHKALEWLIRRYHIHEYNRDDLLMLALPYHESNIFVRIIQLMKFRDKNDVWYFLKSLQKAGVHLNKHSLLVCAANSVSLIKFVGKLIMSLVKEHPNPSLIYVGFNFYCSVFVGAIEHTKAITEAQITQMLPAILKGLSSDIPDFCSASYVIVARLTKKATFSDIILDKLVTKVAQVKVESLKTEAVCLLVVLYQFQVQYKSLDTSCSAVVSNQWMPKILEDLNKNGYKIWAFLEAVVRSCIKAGLKENEDVSRSFVMSLMAAIKFDEAFVKNFLNVLLDAVRPGKQYPAPQVKWLTEIVATIEVQYPDHFDKEVYKLFSAPPEGETVRRKKTLQKLFKDTMTIRGKFDVFDKLYHPNPQLRSEAIAYLKKNFTSLRDGEKEMIKSSLIDRLNDDEMTVVKEALALVKTVSILETDDLKKNLIMLSEKFQTNDGAQFGVELMMEVVLLLCSIGEPDDWEIFLAVFPYLLPNSEEELIRALQLAETSFVKQNCLLKNHGLYLTTSCEEFCNAVFDSLKNDDSDIVKSMLGILPVKQLRNRHVLHKYVVTLVLSYILPDNSPIELSGKMFEIFSHCWVSSEIKVMKVNAEYHKHLKAARRGKFYLEAYLLCTKQIILKTAKPQIDLGKHDFSSSDDFDRYFVNVADAVTVDLLPFKKYCKLFLDYFCPDLQSKVEFCLNLATCGNGLLREDYRSNCLSIITMYLNDTNSDISSFANLDKVIVPYLISLLLVTSDSLSRSVFSIIDLLTKSIPQGSNNYVLLLSGLLQQKEEIILDSGQVPLVVFNVLQSSKGKKEKKENVEILNSLVSTACSPENPPYLKARVLHAISQITEPEVFEAVAKIAIDILKTDTDSLDATRSFLLMSSIIRCEASIAPDIKLDSNIWTFIEMCLKNDKLDVSMRGGSFPSVLLLKQFDSEFFNNLDEEIEAKLLGLIIETVTLTRNPTILPAASRIFKHIDLSAGLILDHFVRMRDAQSPKLDLNKLKRRRCVVPTVDILDTLPWKKGITTLEFIQDKKKIRDRERLLPVLFEILKKCLDFDEQSAVEYPKQLILSSILQCCTKVRKGELPEAVFNMESVVQCIRASQNPQTHHHALLVLAHSATLVPNQVLHHIMAIFTFMGSSVIRHDDAYSYQIISKIIETTIPILVEDNSPKAIGNILRVFVSVMLDVPEHRRHSLYKQLLSTIGVQENLHIFLLLVFESHVFHNAYKSKSKDNVTEENKRRLEIASELCNEFSVEEEIGCCIRLMELIKELPDEKTDDGIPCLSKFGINFATPKQFRHCKYTLVTFITNLLSSREFIGKIASLKDEETLLLEPLHKEIILHTLTYIQRVSKIADENANTPQHKYWKVLLHFTYDILDSINALLTPQMFLLVVKGLLQHSLNTVRKRTLELLNSKLQNDTDVFEGCDDTDVLSLIPLLISIIRGIEQNQLESDEEVIIQTALFSLKLLIKQLASQYKEKFVGIIQFIAQIMRSDKAQNNVLASLVLCLAELCVQLGAYSIPSLPNFMPVLLKVLKQQKHAEKPNVLLLSTVTTLSMVIDTVPLFLSSYLNKMLFELSLLIGKWGSSKESISNKLSSIKSKIGTMIPPRVLVPAVEETYDILVQKKTFEYVGPLLEILIESLNHRDRPEINAILPELSKFFFKALEFRSDGVSTLEQCNLVESQVIKALGVLVLKLSETNFRPLYYQLFDWAVRSEIKSDRVITFYALSSVLADSLKGLFILFAGHIINNIAHILDSCNPVKSDVLYFDDEQKNLLLLENALKTLVPIFTYDSQKFVNQDRFDVLMQPIADQLENNLGGTKALEERSSALLTPCVVHFALATADDALWKQMNYQILLKLRHTSPDVRLIALDALTETVKKLGQDFEPLIAETVPFLSELLEDEEESVEQACRRSIQEMEKVLGTSLKELF